MDIRFVGTDVSKATLDTASLLAGEPGQFTNDGAGIAAIVEWLKGCPVERIVLEATGGYETALVASLAPAGFQVAGSADATGVHARGRARG